MKTNLIKGSLFLALLFSSVIHPFAQKLPEKPVPPRLVNDYAGLLSADEVRLLESKLVHFYDSTSNQVAIVVLQDLDGYEISDYAFALGEKWGIGMKGRNNGILILVKPKTAEAKGQVFIATGYGAEGAVPDGAAKIITDHEILPNFRNGKYFAGLDAATNVIIQLMKGEYSWADYEGKRPSANQENKVPALVVVFFFLFLMLLFIFKAVRNSKKAHTLSGSSIPWWIWAGMMSSGGSHNSASGWGSFNSGSGIFGGGGGGGFGGFGGGSFGGGGAGGSW